MTDLAEVYSIDVATGLATLLDQLTFLPSQAALSLQIDSAGAFWYLNSLLVGMGAALTLMLGAALVATRRRTA